MSYNILKPGVGRPFGYNVTKRFYSFSKGLFTCVKARRMHCILIGCPICGRQVIGCSRTCSFTRERQEESMLGCRSILHGVL
jgi:hypothetical protein